MSAIPGRAIPALRLVSLLCGMVADAVAGAGLVKGTDFQPAPFHAYEDRSLRSLRTRPSHGRVAQALGRALPGWPRCWGRARAIDSSQRLGRHRLSDLDYGTRASRSGRSTTLSCSFGSVRAPTKTAGVSVRLAATWATPAGI